MFPEFREVTHNPVGLDSPFQKDPKMKLTNFSKLILFGLIVTLPAIGCRTKSNYLTQLPKAGTTGSQDSGNGKALIDDGNKVKSDDVSGTAFADPNLRKDWPRDREIFQTDTVHFDFDSSVIKSEEKPKVVAVADYIKAHGSDAVEIEGHCDARGTEEYNRSLGERRALALREELIRLGIEPSRVDTISYGEDRPAETGHDEAAYRKNRRAEFVLEKHQNLVGLNSPVQNNDPNK